MIIFLAHVAAIVIWMLRVRIGKQFETYLIPSELSTFEIESTFTSLLNAYRAKKPHRKSDLSSISKELLDVDELKIEITPRAMLRKDGRSVIPIFKNDIIDF